MLLGHNRLMKIEVNKLTQLMKGKTMMTYEEIDLSAGRDSADCQVVMVSEGYVIEPHYIKGADYWEAVENLKATAWLNNSKRSIVYTG